MTLPRRQFLYLATGAAALPALPLLAMAQAYPTRPVRIIVATSAGGATDILARLLGQWLSERLGQPFVIENRPGGGGNIGTEAVAKAAPDGYTLLLVNSANAVNAALYDKLSFNFIRDVAPVAGIGRESLVMLVHPSFPAKSVAEFIAYAKASPGKISAASPGNGSVGHVAGELFKMQTGINMVHVPYRGSAPALTDLIAGQIQVFFGSTTTAIAHIRAGRLRALAVTTAKRSETLPEIPTVDEFLAGFEASFWTGVGTPRNTPAEIIDRLNKEINAALADSSVKARIAGMGGIVAPGSPADFGSFIVEETDKWAKVVKFAGIKKTA
jgi:tripartite-type tricarboxylate transporter receptor subunit TctC